MAKDEVGVVRQYDFSHGPNYTDDIYNLTDKEMYECEDMIWDGKLKRMPGTTRIYQSTAFSGTNHVITSVYQYPANQAQNKFIIATTDQGKIGYAGATNWTILKHGLSTAADTFWDWVVFNNTLIGLNGRNTPQTWDGAGGSTLDLGGTPPTSRFAAHHAVDYLLFAGHTSNRSEVRYSDTADAETWPVGNSLIVGRNDGQIITGLQRFGLSTLIFKDSSIWILSGNSPNDFDLNPTTSDVGCIAPESIVLTDAGVFFWSDGGPALFNGFKTTLLSKRLRRIIHSSVDASKAVRFSAAYYPGRKLVLVSYVRQGQTQPDRALVFDMTKFGDRDNPHVFWPVTQGFTAAGVGDLSGNTWKRPLLGHTTGHVSTFDHVTPVYTWNGSTLTPRVRTGALHLGKPDRVQLVRDITLRTLSQAGRVTVKYAVDGATTFTTHASTPYSTLKSGSNVHQKMLEGDGAGNYISGNVIQLDISASGTTGFELHGYEVGSETTDRREPVIS